MRPDGDDPRTDNNDSFLIRPDPADPKLTERVSGVDQDGNPAETSVTV